MANSPLTHSEVIDVVHRKLNSTQKSIHSDFRRGLSALGTIAATAPFVGLFGTTLGLMNSFRGGGGQKEAFMAATTRGISEALITTALGLLVAVPAALAYNYFSTKLEFLDTENSLTSDALVAALTSRLNRKGKTS
jgi:biopolymer transport protein ExbB/TolQ